jgi:hypothetical protein
MREEGYLPAHGERFHTCRAWKGELAIMRLLTKCKRS